MESGERGEKTKFSCPFHGWTFDNEGKLAGYPKKDQFGDIDKDCYGLKGAARYRKIWFSLGSSMY